jgi:hypothetical protein
MMLGIWATRSNANLADGGIRKGACSDGISPEVCSTTILGARFHMTANRCVDRRQSPGRSWEIRDWGDGVALCSLLQSMSRVEESSLHPATGRPVAR